MIVEMGVPVLMIEKTPQKPGFAGQHQRIGDQKTFIAELRCVKRGGAFGGGFPVPLIGAKGPLQGIRDDAGPKQVDMQRMSPAPGDAFVFCLGWLGECLFADFAVR